MVAARPAQPDDLAGVIVCAAQFTALPPDPVRVAELFESSCACNGMFVAEHDGQVIGFLCALRHEHAFTGRDYVEVVAWWVPPDWRSHGAGIALLRELLRWCSTLTLDMVTISSPLSSNLGTVLRAFGFRPAEVLHVLGRTWDVKGAGCSGRRSRKSRKA